MQEDLSSMFSQNLRFSNDQQLENVKPTTEMTAEEPIHREGTNPIAYNISQHYHHSSHTATTTFPSKALPDASSELLSPSDEEILEILLRSNINPSSLLTSQLTLFKYAGKDQRSRLIELWRISPSASASYGDQELTDHLGRWQNTTLEQEEEMARLRSQQNQPQALKTGDDMEEAHGQDDTQGTGTAESEIQTVEPYMRSGYEYLAQRDYNEQVLKEMVANEISQPLGSTAGRQKQATDPVYQPREWWHEYMVKQPMECQYGMFEQVCQLQPQTRPVVEVDDQADEEML